MAECETSARCRLWRSGGWAVAPGIADAAPTAVFSCGYGRKSNSPPAGFEPALTAPEAVALHGPDQRKTRSGASCPGAYRAQPAGPGRQAL